MGRRTDKAVEATINFLESQDYYVRRIEIDDRPYRVEDGGIVKPEVPF
jgi:hypothetical protein